MCTNHTKKCRHVCLRWMNCKRPLCPPMHICKLDFIGDNDQVRSVKSPAHPRPHALTQALSHECVPAFRCETQELGQCPYSTNHSAILRTCNWGTWTQRTLQKCCVEFRTAMPAARVATLSVMHPTAENTELSTRASRSRRPSWKEVCGD